MKKPILIAALAIIGSQILFSPAAQSHDHDNWNRNMAPYGYGYNNGHYNNGYNNQGSFVRHRHHERREAIRHERRAVRHWDHNLNRWF